MTEKKDMNLIRNFLIKNVKNNKDISMMNLPFLKLNLLHQEFLDVETEKKEQLINSETIRLIKNNSEDSSFISEIRIKLMCEREKEKIKKNLKYNFVNKSKIKQKFKENLSLYNQNSSSINPKLKKFLLSSSDIEEKNKNSLNKSNIINKNSSSLNIKPKYQLFVTKVKANKSNLKKRNKSSYSLHSSFKENNCNSDRNKKIEEILKKTSKEGFNIEVGINKILENDISEEKDKKNKTFSKQNIKTFKRKLNNIFKKYKINQKEEYFPELKKLEKDNNENKPLKQVKDYRTGKYILMKEGKADLVNFGDAYSKMEDGLFYNNRKPILSRYPEIRLNADIKIINNVVYVNDYPERINRNTNKMISLYYKNKKLYNSIESQLENINENNYLK